MRRAPLGTKQTGPRRWPSGTPLLVVIPVAPVPAALPALLPTGTPQQESDQLAEQPAEHHLSDGMCQFTSPTLAWGRMPSGPAPKRQAATPDRAGHWKAGGAEKRQQHLAAGQTAQHQSRAVDSTMRKGEQTQRLVLHWVKGLCSIT